MNTNIYRDRIKELEDNQHLISMVPVGELLRFGHEAGLDEHSRVLDLCCGYGTLLKVWSQAFGVSGVGIDRAKGFIKAGKARLTNNRVELICGDVLKYKTRERFDFVVCTELSTGLFDDFAQGLAHLEKFIKPGGKLVFGKLYSKIPEPPQELVEFDGPLPTLREIYEEARRCGYLIITMASDTDAAWEQYVFRGAKQFLAALRKDPEDAWTNKWYRIYFDYRRPYEGWALFGLEKII